MQKFIFIGFVIGFCSCQKSSNYLSKNPQRAAIAYCQLANEGIKGDTAKYNLYRKGYLQDNVTQ